MTLLIIEDEIPAQMQLTRLLRKFFPEIEILGCLDSIVTSQEWSSSNPAPDIILMDVELSDGKCFELFNRVNITSKVIITTAYEDYALPAFKTKCIDYLLKPISESEFKASMERCIGFCQAEEALESAEEAYEPDYRTKFTIKIGNHILIADVHDIAFFYSESKATYLVTTDRKQYFLDSSLESLEQQLNPKDFFRLSRSCITSLAAISNISKHFNSRLRVTLVPDVIEPVLVSRARVPLLMEWLDR